MPFCKMLLFFYAQEVQLFRCQYYGEGSGMLILSGRNITADSEKNQKKSISLGRIVW